MIGRLNGTSRRIVALAVAAVAGRKRFKLTMTLMPQGFHDRFQPAAATRHLSREVQAGWGDCLTVLVKRRRLNLLMMMVMIMMMTMMMVVVMKTLNFLMTGQSFSVPRRAEGEEGSRRNLEGGEMEGGAVRTHIFHICLL